MAPATESGGISPLVESSLKATLLLHANNGRLAPGIVARVATRRAASPF